MPLALLLSRLIGIEGIWTGIVAGNLLSSILGAVWAAATSRRLEMGIEEPIPAAQSRE
jgi:Na+-driven multidrug efflux pump